MANVEGLRRKSTATRRGELTITEQDGRYVRRDASSVPTTDNTFDIGSSTFRYANIYSTTFRGLATSANYADLAEMYRSDCPLTVGEVVILGGSEEITKCTEQLSPAVFGVVSSQPAFLMNDGLNDSDCYPVVMTGRSPVRVIGTVKKGDRLVASDEPGFARSVRAESIGLISPFQVIGRSLDDKDTEGKGIVEAVIGKL